MINEYENGGLKMLDIDSFNKALKTMWILKYLDKSNKGKWKLLFDYYLQNYGGKLAFDSNLNKRDRKIVKIKDDFIKEVFDIWADLQYQNVTESFDDFLEQNLWNNSLIRIDDIPVCFQEWIKQGIGKVKDLTKQDNVEKFLSHLEFKTMYEIDTSFPSYFGLISCLIKL